MKATDSQPKMSEAELLASVRQLATLRKWLVYHTHNSKRSEVGFPDLVLVRKTRLLFVELKSAKGKLSPEQALWIETLQFVGCKVEAYIWRPAHWLDGTIDKMLR